MAEEQQQPEQQEERQDRGDGDAAAARETAVRTAVSMGVQLAILLAISFVVNHQDAIALQAKRLRVKISRSRAPGDAGLQTAEFAASVSAWDHAEKRAS